MTHPAPNPNPRHSQSPLPWRLSSAEGDGKTYIVADDAEHGQSSGVALIFMLKTHRPGSADRVPPADVQEQNADLLLRAVNNHDVLLSALHRAASCLAEHAAILAKSGGGFFARRAAEDALDVIAKAEGRS